MFRTDNKFELRILVPSLPDCQNSTSPSLLFLPRICSAKVLTTKRHQDTLSISRDIRTSLSFFIASSFALSSLASINLIDQLATAGAMFVRHLVYTFSPRIVVSVHTERLERIAICASSSTSMDPPALSHSISLRSPCPEWKRSPALERTGCH